MHYGIPTLMEFPDIRKLAQFCSECGFAFLEMNMTFPWFQPGTINANALHELKTEYGIDFTVHLHNQVNPFEFSPEMRKAALENIAFAMDLAAACELPRITMHLQPGTYSSINGQKVYLYEQYKDGYLEHVADFIGFVNSSLHGNNTVFCIENTSGFQSFHRDAIEMMLQSDRFGLTFDIGHNYKAGGNDESFILEHPDKLKHFHIHDCSIRSNHLAFGKGGLNIVHYLKMAEKFDCPVVVEVKESKALIRSKKFIEEHNLW